MKKLFSILIIFISTNVFAQSPVIVNRASQANTVQDARLAAKYNFILPRFNDTTEANLQIGLDSVGAKIFTRNNNKEWIRKGNPKRWVADITQQQLDDSAVAIRTDKQDNLTLTTTGTSGAATLTGSTLNIPQYSGGGSAPTLNDVLQNGFQSYYPIVLTDDSPFQAEGNGNVAIFSSNGFSSTRANGFSASILFTKIGNGQSAGGGSAPVIYIPTLPNGSNKTFALSLNGVNADSTGNIKMIDSTITLSSGTLTVNDTRVKTGAKIFVSCNTPSGTQGILSVPTGSIVNATSFVINSSSATDNSTVNYQIINP